MTQVVQGILIPFLGTTLGAACALFLKNNLPTSVQRILTGFAAGIMTAASVWSLLIPALEQESDRGRLAFLPAAIGFLVGIAFLLLLDRLIPHLHMNSKEAEGIPARLKKTTMLVFAVTLHNIPEGMSVGILYAGWMTGNKSISLAAAFSLAIGIAIQNFPEGAIVSVPLHGNGWSRKKAFAYGVLSGVVEPVAGAITIVLASFIIPIMPYLLSFAAGAMMYVVVDELVPEMSEGGHSNKGTIAFMIGFCLMMTLDVALG